MFDFRVNKMGDISETTEEATKIAEFLLRAKEAFNNDARLLEGDIIGGQILGGQSYDSLLANIITSYRDVFEAKERGMTALWKADLKSNPLSEYPFFWHGFLVQMS